MKKMAALPIYFLSRFQYTYTEVLSSPVMFFRVATG